MFFVDQVGVKAPGSPRRMTRRPLQRCAKFTALRETTLRRRRSEASTRRSFTDAEAALWAGEADIQVDRRRLIAERCKSAAALAEHRRAAQRAGKHGARVQLRPWLREP